MGNALDKSVVRSLDSDAAPPLDSAQRKWVSDELMLLAPHMESTESQLRTALEDVFAPNRFTRKQDARKGPSLSVPGLIRAKLSNFTDTRFFSAKTAGAVRDFGFVLCIDASMSMRGLAFANAMVCAFATVRALRAASMDTHLAVLFYGRGVRIVKPMGAPWTPECDARMLSATCDDYGTNDAETIHVAAAMCRDGHERHALMFTDGHSSDAPDVIASAVQAAEDQGVTVTAVACGTMQFGVARSYGRYLAVAHPRDLPTGLREVFAAASSNVRDVPLPADADAEVLGESKLLEDDGIDSFGQLTGTTMKSLAEDDTEMLLLETDGVDVVDFAVCVDLTASMTAFWPKIKRAVVAIAKALEELPELSRVIVRFGVSCFRDVGEQQGPVLHFDTTGDGKGPNVDAAALEKFLERADMKCEGGGDIPEDVLGGMRRCFDTLFKPVGRSPTKARFMIVLSDGPQHGLCTAPNVKDDHAGGVAGVPPAAAAKALMTTLAEGGVFTLMAGIRPRLTRPFFNTLEAAAPVQQGIKALRTSDDLFDDAAARDQFHFIFVLDRSGSMGTLDGPDGSTRLEGVRRATNAFIARRAEQQGQVGSQDAVSIIEYGTTATIQCEAEPLASATVSTVLGNIAIEGGTNFTAALSTAQTVVGNHFERESAASIPVVVFMSDGQGSHTDVVRDMCGVRGREVRFYAVLAYDKSPGAAAVMQRFAADSGTPGSFCHATDTEQLIARFVEIAADTKPADQVAAAVGEKVQQRITSYVAENHK